MPAHWPATRAGTTGGKIVVADQIYRGRFLFASKKLWKQQKHRFRYPVSRTATEEKYKKVKEADV
jgi:hypothetical protein